MADYEDRQDWDLDAWPEMYSTLKQLQALVFLSPPGIELNLMVFTMSSLAAGCRHCQAHGAYGLDRVGVPLDKIRALWSYRTSELFDERERAALDFAVAAASTPSSVDATHHSAIRQHFSDEEARSLIATVALGGFMNRYNDALAAVTDEESAQWAMANLGPLGWDIGKHVGHHHEQRKGPPGG